MRPGEKDWRKQLKSIRASAAALIIAVAASPPPAGAETQAWSTMAEADLAAAHQFLVENHPGAVPAAGDTAFIAALASGREEAGKLARQARSYGGYRAALQRFAAEFKDAHISSGAAFPLPQRWPGFVAADEGEGWRVVARADEAAPAPGSRLVSCDGRAPQGLVRARLAPFVSDWSAKAQRVRASARLLVDSDNPMHPPLVQCEFATPGGDVIRHPLSWRKLDSAEWAKHMDAAFPIAPEEVYLRAFEGGYWMRLGTLSPKAHSIVQQAEAQQAALRASPFIVIDLRSNGGGASVFTDKLARVIYGARAVHRARNKAGLGPNLMVWRANATTRAEADAYVKRFAPIGAPGDPFLLGLAAQRDAIAKAVEAGSPLASAPIEAGQASSPAVDNVRKPPRVLVVTDRYCFSSCLTGLKLFLDLGALHMGEETNANTHYSNLRTVELPSGLSTFSTMQAYMSALPRKLGPFTPAVPLTALSDDARLQQSVREVLAKGNRRSGGSLGRRHRNGATDS